MSLRKRNQEPVDNYNILDGSHQERQHQRELREGRLWKLLALAVALLGIYIAFSR